MNWCGRSVATSVSIPQTTPEPHACRPGEPAAPCLTIEKFESTPAPQRCNREDHALACAAAGSLTAYTLSCAAKAHVPKP
jgi:hypothetical protein